MTYVTIRLWLTRIPIAHEVQLPLFTRGWNPRSTLWTSEECPDTSMAVMKVSCDWNAINLWLSLAFFPPSLSLSLYVSFSLFLLNSSSAVIWCGHTLTGDGGCWRSSQTGLPTDRQGNPFNSLALYVYFYCFTSQSFIAMLLYTCGWRCVDNRWVLKEF
jgi:hypothetical protein